MFTSSTQTIIDDILHHRGYYLFSSRVTTGKQMGSLLWFNAKVSTSVFFLFFPFISIFVHFECEFSFCFRERLICHKRESARQSWSEGWKRSVRTEKSEGTRNLLSYTGRFCFSPAQVCRCISDRMSSPTVLPLPRFIK